MMGATPGARGMANSHQQRTAGWKACRKLLGRLQDPHDTQAATLVACALLLFEAALCPLIIAKIPCAHTSPIDIRNLILNPVHMSWQRRMQPSGYLAIRRHRAGLGGIHAAGGGLPAGEQAAPEQRKELSLGHMPEGSASHSRSGQHSSNLGMRYASLKWML